MGSFSYEKSALKTNGSFQTIYVNTCDDWLIQKQRSRGRYFSLSKHFT